MLVFFYRTMASNIVNEANKLHILLVAINWLPDWMMHCRNEKMRKMNGTQWFRVQGFIRRIIIDHWNKTVISIRSNKIFGFEVIRFDSSPQTDPSIMFFFHLFYCTLMSLFSIVISNNIWPYTKNTYIKDGIVHGKNISSNVLKTQTHQKSNLTILSCFQFHEKNESHKSKTINSIGFNAKYQEISK